MEYSITIAEQAISLETAKVMSYLQHSYDITIATRPSKRDYASITGVAGENMAAMVITDIQQCTRQPLVHIQASTNNLRHRRANFYNSREFRQACKLYFHEWGMLEAKKRNLDDSATSTLMLDVNRLADLILSPVGIVNLEQAVDIFGRAEPVCMATFSEANLEESYITDFYRRLTYFIGFQDWLDEASAQAVAQMIPETIVPPNWYYQTDVSPTDSVDNHVELYQELCQRYLPLQERHNIRINDGFCKSIQIAEFEGTFGLIPYRFMVGAIQFEEIDAGDVYLILETPHFCRAELLVSKEAADGMGPCVIRQVYDAYAQALEEETGEQIDIYDLVEELEEAIEFDEV